MDIRRFKKIIEYSHSNHGDMESKVKDFYTRIGVEYDRELLDVMQVVRPLLQKKKYIVIEFPFVDKEIGALCYKGESFGYTLLNSSLPKANVNFALCHELYHIFYQEKPEEKRVELYMNEHYYDDPEELAANLFAGMLLMPEHSYRMMFRKFRQDAAEGEADLPIVIKLMSYFKVPYMAALVRCYELELLESGETLEKLMNVDGECIKNEFARLWLDDSILYATQKDDFGMLELIVSSYGKQYTEEGLVSKRTVTNALQNMREIYGKIKGE